MNDSPTPEGDGEELATPFQAALERQMTDFLKRSRCSDSALVEESRRAILRLIAWSVKHSSALELRDEDRREPHVGAVYSGNGVLVWSTYPGLETAGKVELLPGAADRLSEMERATITAAIEALAPGRSIGPRQALQISLSRIVSDDEWSIFEPALNLAGSAAGRSAA